MLTAEKLEQIAHEINTQDNRITADPLFCVFEKEQIWGVDLDYTDTWEWCNSGGECHCKPGEECEDTLGQYCFVGAGAVITRNVGDHALVAGNPARRLGWVCACGERLPDDYQCPSCNKKYRLNGNDLVGENKNAS